MDDHLWQSFIGKKALLVPTRSLQTTLQQALGVQQKAAGRTVWESANIFTWTDYLNKLWAANQLQMEDVSTLLSDAQGRLLWHRVIERSKFEDKELALLNVPQTAQAAQRSWNLLHDWRLAPIVDDLLLNKDTQQFSAWAKEYKEQLRERCLIDTSLLISRLTDLAADGTLRSPFETVCWYSFDLITAAQHAFISASDRQIRHEFDTNTQSPPAQRDFRMFAHGDDELEYIFNAARQRVEQDPDCKISIVIPDLQRRVSKVQTIANRVFYAGKSPLELANNDLVFRFSLGLPIADWSATQAAVNVLKLLRGRVSNNDLRRLLRCRFLQRVTASKDQANAFDAVLQKSRLSSISLSSLPEIFQTHVADKDSERLPELQALLHELDAKLTAIKHELQQAAEQHQYQTLTFRRWREIFSDLLELLNWSTAPEGDTLSSLQHQLKQSWNSMLAEFELMDQAQGKVGLNRALEVLQQLARDTVFLPEAAPSPIFVSGVFEALGSQVDVCFLTGMHEDYPMPAKSDPFIGQLLKQSDTYPSATVASHYKQAKTVISNLQKIADECHISFAQLDDDDPAISKSVSPLFREYDLKEHTAPEKTATEPQKLESFTDITGPPISDGKQIRSGIRVFTDQSNCAFRAFAMHRLQCEEEREAEFGLDQLDRGNIVHLLLERAWERLQSKAELQRLDKNGWINKFVQETTRKTILEASEELPAEKRKLLALEEPRLHTLLSNWLQLELARPQGFTAVELEVEHRAEIAGISLRFKLDRLDSLDDGRTVVIDYKTGGVNRNDWQGDRLSQPQLPLYAIALESIKRIPPAGIAYAQIQKKESQFVELAEEGIFRKDDRWSRSRHEDWLAAKESWPDYFATLANEFLSGSAPVNPIEEATCQYCDLKPLCRISQLRSGWETSHAE